MRESSADAASAALPGKRLLIEFKKLLPDGKNKTILGQEAGSYPHYPLVQDSYGILTQAEFCKLDGIMVFPNRLDVIQIKKRLPSPYR